MALQLSYNAQADVPDNLKGAYIEKDGKFVLDVDVPDTSKLEAAVKATRKERDDAVTALRKVEAERDDAKKELDALTADGVTKGKKVTELLEQWKKDTEERVRAAEKAKDEFYAPQVAKVTKYELDDVLVEAFEKAGGRSEKRASMLALAKAQGWALVDGKAVKRDGSGEITNVTLDDFFAKDFKKQEGEYYKGTQAGGGGAAGMTKGSESNGSLSLEDFKKMSPSDQLAWARKHETGKA